MKSILEKIVAAKKAEVEERKSLYPEKLLKRSLFFETKSVSLRQYLLRTDLHGIIAEFKRKSPSKGMINEFAQVETTTLGYMQAGASALSVLTDNQFFGGSNEDLSKARKFNFCPILRKDFIIDPYQLIEAKSIGADAILLIAAILKKSEIESLGKQALELGLEVLLELHDVEEIEKIPDFEVIIGVNNRNLKTMTTTIETALLMSKKLPVANLKVAESGITDASVLCSLKQNGYQGFLIGEQFMKHRRPELGCKKMIEAIKQTKPC